MPEQDAPDGAELGLPRRSIFVSVDGIGVARSDAALEHAGARGLADALE
jgi:hypothetical protein